MHIRFLNCFTCNARVPSNWRTGTLCLLVETDRGLVLVDTGLGRDDYVHRTAIMRAFRLATIVPMDAAEAAVEHVLGLGHKPNDVRHIVLTHMHFDHCGGLPDFPHARVHVHRREYEAFWGPPRRWTDLAYVGRHVAHEPEFALYDDGNTRWFDFAAIRLPFEPEMWLVPLFGHTRGHCGVAIQTTDGWLFHVGDAAPMNFCEGVPKCLVNVVPGPARARSTKSRRLIAESLRGSDSATP